MLFFVLNHRDKQVFSHTFSSHQPVLILSFSFPHAENRLPAKEETRSRIPPRMPKKRDADIEILKKTTLGIQMDS